MFLVELIASSFFDLISKQARPEWRCKHVLVLFYFKVYFILFLHLGSALEPCAVESTPCILTLTMYSLYSVIELLTREDT